MASDEYQALRNEIVARHTTAVAVYTASFAILAAILGLSNPSAGQSRPVQTAVGCLALQSMLIGMSLVIRAMHRTTNRIGTYIRYFHEEGGSGRYWETANFRPESRWYYSKQCIAMGLSYCLIGTVIWAYAIYSIREAPRWAFLAVPLTLLAGFQIAAAVALCFARNRRYIRALLDEWKQVHAARGQST